MQHLHNSLKINKLEDILNKKDLNLRSFLFNRKVFDFERVISLKRETLLELKRGSPMQASL